MNLDTSVDQLLQKHHELEGLISEENGRPIPDDTRIATLKKEKLRIKDELYRLQHDS
jgi:hypothetical protein